LLVRLPERQFNPKIESMVTHVDGGGKPVRGRGGYGVAGADTSRTSVYRRLHAQA